MKDCGYCPVCGNGETIIKDAQQWDDRTWWICWYCPACGETFTTDNNKLCVVPWSQWWEDDRPNLELVP